MRQDTRLTEWRKPHRVYRCDRCGAVKRFLGRIDGFDGTYLDQSWRGRPCGRARVRPQATACFLFLGSPSINNCTNDRILKMYKKHRNNLMSHNNNEKNEMINDDDL